MGFPQQKLTKGKITGSHKTHFDPDLREESLARKPGWLPALGQVEQAQSHLKNNNVRPGDIFLFFGWFRETVRSGKKLEYKKGARNLHVLFGWLQIGDIYKPAMSKEDIPGWALGHPHVEAAENRWKNNTLYVATEYLELPGLKEKIKGGVSVILLKTSWITAIISTRPV